MIKNKSFNLRLPLSTWMFLKKHAAENETSMGEIIISCLIKLQEKKQKRLTKRDANV